MNIIYGYSCVMRFDYVSNCSNVLIVIGFIEFVHGFSCVQLEVLCNVLANNARSVLHFYLTKHFVFFVNRNLGLFSLAVSYC